MDKKLLMDSFGWGFVVWLMGYGLGIVFFTIVPHSLIGWFVTPIGIVVALFVLFKKIKVRPLNYYLLISIIWAAIAIFCDYFFLVTAFKPIDGYYKLDVFLYYVITFSLPLIVGAFKLGRK